MQRMAHMRSSLHAFHEHEHVHEYEDVHEYEYEYEYEYRREAPAITDLPR